MTQIGILWAILTTVLFVFPPELPTTPSNMNYCIAAFGVMLLIAGLTWIFDGRKNYTGPIINEGVISGSIIPDRLVGAEISVKLEDEMADQKWREHADQ